MNDTPMPDITDIRGFVNYVLSFYGKGSDLWDMGVTRTDVLEALVLRLTADYGVRAGTIGSTQCGEIYRNIPFTGDSFDREHVRDMLIHHMGFKPHERWR